MQVWILEIVTHDEHDYTDREDVYLSKEAAWPDFEALVRDRSESGSDFTFALEGATEHDDGSVTVRPVGSWDEIRLVPVDVLTTAKTRQDADSPSAAAEAAVPR